MGKKTEAEKLKEMIDHAIADGVVTNQEYHDILAQAADDGYEDSEERALLSSLQHMIATGVVKRVERV